MMGPVCWSLAMPLLLGATQDDLPANWKALVSQDGRFTVALPSSHTQSKKKITTATGQLDATIVVAEGRNDSCFVVSYCDFPLKELKADSVEKRLEQACKGAVEKSGGKLRGAEKPIQLDGKHPGREIVIEKKGEVIAKMRIYLVERRLYQVMVLGNGPIFAPKEKDVGIFLDSFRLNK
jgi:hypothetical protein